MGQMERLMGKALDGDPMTARELRDFGAAMIARPELAEEYVALRRIVRDAPRATGLGPSAGFTDRVMAEVASAPQPEPAGHIPVWPLVGVCGVTVALALVGIYGWAVPWVQSAPSWRPALVPLDFVADQGRMLAQWLAGWNIGAPGGGLNAWLVWLSAPALALMAGVNVWMARFGREGF